MASALGNDSPKRAQTAPVEKRILNDSDAFKKTLPADPSWTMASRDGIQDPLKYNLVTELGPDICKNLGACKPVPPKWSMQPRWKSEDAKGGWVPGPGKYPMASASTLTKTHPTIPGHGKALGATWGCEERKTIPSMGSKDAPDPCKYDPVFTQTRERVRDASIRGRFNTLPPTRGKNGIWAEVTKAEANQPRTIYNVAGQCRRGGASLSRSWTMLGRPQSTLVPKGENAPGPGASSPDLYSNGQIKRPPSFGFGTSSRWAKDPEPRPY